MLIEEGLVSAERFDLLSREAERKNQNLLDLLVAAGVADANYLAHVVARALGVPRVDFAKTPLDKDVVRVLPEDVARRRQAIVFAREPNGVYDAAMLNPADLSAIEFLTQFLKAKIKPPLATLEDLNRGYAVYGYELGQDFKRIIEEHIRASLSVGAKTIAEAAADLPVVGIVDNLLSYAVASRASDIHIEVL